jgi:hypothetical protein
LESAVRQKKWVKLTLITWLWGIGVGWGGVMYVLVGLVGIDGGGGVNFGSKACQGPEEGMGLILIFGAMAGKGFVDVAASLEIICRTYVGYSPRPAKFFCTTSLNSFRVQASALSSQSKYWHISHLI